MATYLNKDFNAVNYAKFRPTYPDSLYAYIKSYRARRTKEHIHLAVDLACGTGQATRGIADFCEHVIGIDHSEAMVKQAREDFPPPQFEFRIGSEKNLVEILGPHSVDLLTVAEAAHWLDFPVFWEQAASVLKPGGTLAIFSYWLFSFPEYPAVSAIIDKYCNGEQYCGPFWDEGRDLLKDDYAVLRDTITKSEFTGIDYRVNDFDQLRPEEPFELVKHNYEVGGMISLIKTWSVYYTYQKKFLNAPDLTDTIMAEITKATGLKPEDCVTVKWKTVMLLATKK